MVIPDFDAFAEVVTTRVLPTFDTFGTEALRRGEEHFRTHAGNLDPLGDEQFEAASYFADEALDETFAYADMLVSMYFASIGPLQRGVISRCSSSTRPNLPYTSLRRTRTMRRSS
jgi:hypothetical protein